MQDKHIKRLQRQARKAGRHAQQGSTVVLHTGSVYAGLQRLSKAGSRCAGVLLHAPSTYLDVGGKWVFGRLYAFTDSNVKHVLPADAGYSVHVQHTPTSAVQAYTDLHVLQAFRQFAMSKCYYKASVQHSTGVVLATHAQAADVTQQILQANKDN